MSNEKMNLSRKESIEKAKQYGNRASKKNLPSAHQSMNKVDSPMKPIGSSPSKFMSELHQ